MCTFGKEKNLLLLFLVYLWIMVSGVSYSFVSYCIQCIFICWCDSCDAMLAEFLYELSTNIQVCSRICMRHNIQCNAKWKWSSQIKYYTRNVIYFCNLVIVNLYVYCTHTRMTVARCCGGSEHDMVWQKTYLIMRISFAQDFH